MKLLKLSDLTHFWGNVRKHIPTKTSDLTNDSNFAVDSNVLHNSGDETSSGNKTFSSTLRLTGYPNVRMYVSNDEWNVQPTDTKQSEIRFTDKNSVIISYFAFQHRASSTEPFRTCWRQLKMDGTLSYYSVDFNNLGDFYPENNNTINLGNSSNRWKGIYSTNYYYGSDNVEFSTKFVTTDTSQTISGVKTFTDDISLKSLTGEYTVTGSGRSVTYSDKNSLLLAQNKLGNYQNGISYNKFTIYAYDSNNQLIDRTLTYSSNSNLLATTYFRPDNDNIVSLGTSGNRWSKVYATNYYYGSDNTEFSTKFVTTDTAQTIAGVKTFSDNTYITSLNFTNEVESQSSSSSAVFPIVTTVAYADQSPSQTARLNFRITANGDKSLYPHENNQYSFGVASRRWTTLYGYLANLGGTYVGNEASANERSNLYLLANRDTDGQSGAYIGRFRQNRAQGAMSGGDVSFVSLDFLENSTRYTRCFTMGLTDWDSNGVPQTYYITAPNGKGSLGTSYQQWNKVYANEYYYGSTNTEFSSKFVTTDTVQVISGNKTFSRNVYIYDSDTSVNARYLILKNQNVKRGSTTETGTQFITFHDKDGGTLVSYDTNVSPTGNTQAYINVSNLDANSQRVIGGVKVIKTPTETWFIPDDDNTVSSGLSNYKWKDVNTYLVNGLIPSSLSMPDIANKIDISSYVSDLTGAGNEYTPTVNGWICVRSGDATKISILDSATNIGTTSISPTATYLTVLVPCIANRKVYINIMCTSLSHAYFIPCQGNV